MLLDQRISACLRTAAAALLVVAMSASARGVFASEQAQGQTPPQQPAVPTAAATTQVPSTTLRVSPDEAVRMALQNNLGIRAEQLTPQIETFGVAQARAAYAPSLTSQTTTRSSTAPPSDFITGGGDILTNDSFRTNAGIQQFVPWGGGRYTLSLDASRLTTSNVSSRFNPQLDSALNVGYVQPLLRGFSIDAVRQNVLVSEKQQQIADVQLRQTVTQTSRAVRNAYYDLVNAIASHQVAQQSLELSQTSLKNNQRRVEVGTMAPIDIVQAQAEVAALEEQVIVAEGQISAAEDRLRTLVMNPSQPDFWTTHLEPSEQPTLTPQPIDVDGAVRNALANRTDIAQLRKQMETTDINLRFYKNQRLPALDVSGTYNLVGTAGTQRQFDLASGIYPPPVLNESQRSFTDALRDVFGNQFKTWAVQLNLSYPLGTSAADAALAAGRLQHEQQTTTLQELETNIVAQVREAARQVSTSLKRVESTKKARELAEQSLQAEEKRLAVGLSDTYRVLQSQRDLARQRVNELNAIIAYNRALVNFEAVQIVPLGGGGF
jgi:outer membrane protein